MLLLLLLPLLWVGASVVGAAVVAAAGGAYCMFQPHLLPMPGSNEGCCSRQGEEQQVQASNQVACNTRNSVCCGVVTAMLAAEQDNSRKFCFAGASYSIELRQEQKQSMM
jgi:hypothetical protein